MVIPSSQKSSRYKLKRYFRIARLNFAKRPIFKTLKFLKKLEILTQCDMVWTIAFPGCEIAGEICSFACVFIFEAF